MRRCASASAPVLRAQRAPGGVHDRPQLDPAAGSGALLGKGQRLLGIGGLDQVEATQRLLASANVSGHGLAVVADR